MNSKEYAEKAFRTMSPLINPFDNELHMVLGMVTEAGELADAYKKALAYHKDIDYINVKEEAGDLLWYVSNMCTLIGWTLEEVFDLNIAKLDARYNGGVFSAEKANNRDLLHEREILENT